MPQHSQMTLEDCIALSEAEDGKRNPRDPSQTCPAHAASPARWSALDGEPLPPYCAADVAVSAEALRRRVKDDELSNALRVPGERVVLKREPLRQGTVVRVPGTVYRELTRVRWDNRIGPVTLSIYSLELVPFDREQHILDDCRECDGSGVGAHHGNCAFCAGTGRHYTCQACGGQPERPPCCCQPEEPPATEWAASIWHREPDKTEALRRLSQWIYDAPDRATSQARKSAAFVYMYGTDSEAARRKFQRFLESDTKLSYPEWSSQPAPEPNRDQRRAKLIREVGAAHRAIRAEFGDEWWHQFIDAVKANSDYQRDGLDKPPASR